MRKSTVIGNVLRSVVGVVLTATAARAQEIPAACKPAMDAGTKVISTPHHAYSTTTGGSPGAKPMSGETISAGGVTYVQYKGEWRRSPITMQELLDQNTENVHNAKNAKCRVLHDDMVDGVATAVYSMHSESDEAISDAQVWVGKTNGLLLREEMDVSVVGSTDKRHISMRFEYTNVRAPAVTK